MYQGGDEAGPLVESLTVVQRLLADRDLPDVLVGYANLGTGSTGVTRAPKEVGVVELPHPA